MDVERIAYQRPTNRPNELMLMSSLLCTDCIVRSLSVYYSAQMNQMNETIVKHSIGKKKKKLSFKKNTLRCVFHFIFLFCFVFAFCLLDQFDPCHSFFFIVFQLLFVFIFDE